MRYLSLAFILFLNIVVNAQTARQPVLITDMLKIKTVNAVTLTSDGRMAAFVVNAIEPESDSSKWEYKYTSQVWITATDAGSVPRQLTFSKEGASQPAWSPDGKQLAFVRAVDGRAQLFILSLSGGEPLQLTKFKYGASSPRWSPDGKRIVFSASVRIKELFNDSLLNPEKKFRNGGWKNRVFQKMNN